MYKVHVTAKDGQVLDPTTRFGKVRRMLKNGDAVVVKRKPFTIRLAYGISDPVTHTCIGSTDPGRTNIGNAVIRLADDTVVYTDKVETRNKEIPKLMSNRKAHRQASRRGERLTRKRLARKHKTLSKKLSCGRLIPGCEKPTDVKDIINTESRFMNRKRHNNMKDVLQTPGVGWLTPTVKQLVQTHLNHVDQIRKLYPVTGWCLELNKFAFMRMEDGTVRGVDFQNGRMKGYKNIEEYVFAMQEGKCAVCRKPLDDCHHIIPRSQNGSDGPDNRIGLCEECHHKVHTGELDLDKAGEKQKYGALSVLNQAVPYILLALEERFGEENVHVCTGYETKLARELFGIPKDHDNDAVAIASACLGTELKDGHEERFEVKQYRRHDRAVVRSQRERTYKLLTGYDKKGRPQYEAVAKNRRPREDQQGPALNQWFEKLAAQAGLQHAEETRSRLKAVKSTRYYNRKDRLMPGMVFLHEGTRYVMTGQLSGGDYLRALWCESKNFPFKDCQFITKNEGLVYV